MFKIMILILATLPSLAMEQSNEEWINFIKKEAEKEFGERKKSSPDVPDYLKRYMELINIWKETPLTYINDILELKEFRKDPKKYVENWIQRRGGQENHISPDDDALEFFKKHLLPDLNNNHQ